MTTWTCIRPGRWSAHNGRFLAVLDRTHPAGSSIGNWDLTDEQAPDRYAIQHTLRACRRVVERWLEVDAMRALVAAGKAQKKEKALDDSKGASK